MSHILKFSEWESNGKWYCADVTDLGHDSAIWWYPARMLDMALDDYILMLKDKFHAENFKLTNKNFVLIFNFRTEKDCHAFVLFINREAKKRKFFIC